LAYGQKETEPPARVPLPPGPASVNLNDSDNARKARAILDQTIEAMGGQPYLTYENREETGRYYPLYHGRTNSTGIPYNYYVEYPDKDRFEVIHTKDIFLLEGSVGNVKVKGQFDLVQIFNGDKGYETTYKGRPRWNLSTWRTTCAAAGIRWNGSSASGFAIRTWRCSPMGSRWSTGRYARA